MTKQEFQAIQNRIKDKGDYMINRLMASNKGQSITYMHVFHVVWHEDSISFYKQTTEINKVEKVEIKRKNISKIEIDFPGKLSGTPRAVTYRILGRYIQGYKYE